MTPIVIPTKGRAGSALTMKALAVQQRKVWLSVEPQEVEAYQAAYPECGMIILPDSGRGVSFSRLYAMGKLRREGVTSVWLMDDDITGLSVWKGATFSEPSSSLLSEGMEKAERVMASNPDLGIAGFSIKADTFGLGKNHNRREFDYTARGLFQCILVNLRTGIDFKDTRNMREDTDFCIANFHAGWGCVMLSKYEVESPLAGRGLAGGLAADYKQKERIAMSNKWLADQWPQYCVPKGNRHPSVHWSKFKASKVNAWNLERRVASPRIIHTTAPAESRLTIETTIKDKSIRHVFRIGKAEWLWTITAMNGNRPTSIEKAALSGLAASHFFATSETRTVESNVTLPQPMADLAAFIVQDRLTSEARFAGRPPVILGSVTTGSVAARLGVAIEAPYRLPSLGKRPVILMSFGKESVLTLAILRKLGLEPTLIYIAVAMEKATLVRRFAAENGVKLVIIKNNRNLLRDRIPHSGCFDHLTVLPFLKDCTSLLMGNEMENRLDAEMSGHVRPQSFQQSPLYAGLFSALSGIPSGTLLDGLTELGCMDRLFRRFPECQNLVRSCWKWPPLGRAGQPDWCGKCAKCYEVDAVARRLGIVIPGLRIRTLSKPHDQSSSIYHQSFNELDKRVMEIGTRLVPSPLLPLEEAASITKLLE